MIFYVIFFRYIVLPCEHSIKRSQLIPSDDLAEIPSCSICFRPISQINRSLHDVYTILMYKKEAVVKVFEEYFVLKSTIEHQKKELVAMCKLSSNVTIDSNIEYYSIYLIDLV